MTTRAPEFLFEGTMPENYERYFAPVIPIPVAQDLLDLARLEPGERVLDVATGTGIPARFAAEAVGPTGGVVGVDVAPAMLEMARSLSAASQTPIDWRQGSAEALPVEDDSFDVALSLLGLMLVPDRAAACREIHRALVPGGRVVINVPGEIRPINEALAEALARHVSPDAGPFVRHVFSLHDPKELEALLVDAGFREVEAWSADKTLRLPAPADYLWQYVASTPLSQFVASLPEEAKAELEADLVAAWGSLADGDGMVYDQPFVWATARA